MWNLNKGKFVDLNKDLDLDFQITLIFSQLTIRNLLLSFTFFTVCVKRFEGLQKIILDSKYLEMQLDIMKMT